MQGFVSPAPFCPVLNHYQSFWDAALQNFSLNLLTHYPLGSPKTQALALEYFVPSVNKRQNSRHQRNKATFGAKHLTIEAAAVSQAIGKSRT